MKQKLILFVMLMSFTFSIHAQLVVAAPNVEAAVEKQSIQTMRIAFEEKIRQYKYYMEYIAQFTQIIQAINFTASTIRNTVRLGKVLKDRDAKDWLNDAETSFYQAMPEFAELKEELADLKGQGNAVKKGKYFDYVSKWDSQSLNYYESLADNYGKHVMFPELFPLSSKAYGWEKKSNEAVVQKAWLESGMEREMGDDAVRRKTWGKYYAEYEAQAKEVDNIEAIGTARLLQIGMITSEDVNHLRKNSDLEVMEKQYAADAQKSHAEMRTKRQKEEMKKGKPQKDNPEDDIFGISNKKKKDTTKKNDENDLEVKYE
jgi:Asp-tRNA(Asn)/Glu-tRNA(Gln) amidotransferase C subunit